MARLSLIAFFNLAASILLRCSSVMVDHRLPDVSLTEGLAANEVVLNATINFTATGSFVKSVAGHDHPRVFDMYFQHSNAVIRTTRVLNRDAMAVLLQQKHLPVMFEVSIHVLGFRSIDETATVTIRILDVDNNVPTFPSAVLPISLSEGNEVANRFLPLALDDDEGVNTVQNYTLSPENNTGGIFELEVRRDTNDFITDLRLVQTRALDREYKSSYILSIVATEGNSNPDSATLAVNVTVMDVCDQTPKFPKSRYSVSVPENSLDDPFVLRNITAIDSDLSPVITYTIRDVCSYQVEDHPPCVAVPSHRSPFSLDMESRDLTITWELDWEEFAQYEITILAVDDCRKSGTASVVVTVSNINDNAPSGQLVGTKDILEEQDTAFTVYFLSISDPDDGIQSDQSRFTLELFDNSTGVPMETNLFEIWTTPPLQLRVVRPLDREVADGYSLVLNVTDWGTPNMSTILHLPVNVLDVNDHSPTLDGTHGTYMITENIPLTQTIVTLRATDRDAVESGNGRVTYHLPTKNATYPYQEMFSIDQLGRLMAGTILDREDQDHLFVMVEARDNPNDANTEHRSDFVVINMMLTDLNDNVPLILTPPETVNISESQQTSTVVFTVTALDNDTEPYSTLTFSLIPEDVPFRIDPTTGAVTLVSPLDYETRRSYTLEVRASDVSEMGRRTVTVFVENESDERCVFDRNGPYMSSVLENMPANIRVVNINATDMDTPLHMLRFSIEAGNDMGHFTITPGTGEIFTTQTLDHDIIRNYTLSVSCSDGSEFPTETTVFVEVLDKNDNGPQFVGIPYNFAVSENLHTGTVVNSIEAVDADSSHNAAVRYRILGASPRAAESWFTLDESTGVISTARSLDREETGNSHIVLNVEAYDQPISGEPHLFNATLVYIEILDVNDQDPVFSRDSVTFHLWEDYEVGRDFPMHVHAVDADAYPFNVIRYEICRCSSQEDRELFHIVGDAGVLRLTRALDFETNERHTFRVQAIDTDQPHRQATQMIIVVVENVAENNVTFVGFTTDVNVVENSPFDLTVMAFTVTDINETPLLTRLPTLSYSILGADGSVPMDFDIRSDPANSQLIVYISAHIDRESAGVVGNTDTVTRVLNITASDPDPSQQSHGSTSALLRVTILDENDNTPTFGQPSYTFDVVEEGTDLSIPIGRVTARDPDFGINGTQGITYTIPDSVSFEISTNGEIRPTHRLDREAVAQYNFRVVAADGSPSTSTSSSVIVRVNIIDLNDNAPQFDSSQLLTIRIGEWESVNTTVAVLQATDNDTGIFGQVYISAGDIVSPHFHLEPNGSVILIQSLDREASETHFFTAIATDGGGLRSPVAEVNIIVEDFNDNPPVFNRSVRIIMIPEDVQEGQTFAVITAADADLGKNGTVRYAIGNYSLQLVFRINEVTGELSLRPQHSACGRYDDDVIDFERNSEFDVSIVAYDLGIPERHIVSKTIKIVVHPVNEHPPLFDRDFIRVYTNETARSRVEVAQIRAVDLDRNDQISHEVTENGTRSSMFHYDATRQAIVNSVALEYSTESLHLLLVTARDRGGLVGTTQVLIGVNNINNHAPAFMQETVPTASSLPLVISESTPVLTVVWTVKATDEDNATHDAVSFFLEGGEGDFSVDSLTGEISVSSPLDFETRQTYNLQVSAQDTGSPQRTATLPVPLVISIKNENDHPPIFNSTRYFFPFNEEQPTGSIVGRVYATDADIGSFGEVKYSISSANEYFELDQGSGEITARVQIDRDTLASEGATTPVSFQLRVLATDSAPGLAARMAGADVVVEIVDVNDNPPVFDSPQYQFRVHPTHDVSEALGVVQVRDRDTEPNSAHGFEIVYEDGSTALPLMISRSGQLRLGKAIPAAHRPAYFYTINAIDVGNPSLQSKAQVEVIVETPNDHHPRFNPLLSTVSVNEMMEVGQTIFRLRNVVSDEDTGANGELTYHLAQASPNFQVDRTSGVITLRESLDYDEGPRSYSLTLLAVDGRRGTRRTATGTIVVTVEPGNEHTPTFMGMPSHLTLSHLPYMGLELYTVSASDRDDGRDGDIEYKIFDNSHLFAMDKETGVLTNKVEISQDNSYNLTIGAYDLGRPLSRSSNTTICITIRRSADTEPEFVGSSPRTIFQAETDFIDVYLNMALFTNPPASSYHIASQTVSGQTTPIDMFSILESDGKLSTRQPLDHEETAEYRIVVESRVEVTTATSVERLSDFLEVILEVADVNDNSPIFADIEDQSFSEGTLPGTFLFRVHAIDADSDLSGNLSYDIIQEVTFSINSISGEVTLNQMLDRETVSEYDLRIRARDFTNQPRSSLITIHVTITDVNDFATSYSGRNFSLEVYEYPHTVRGERIVKLAAIDEDEGPLMYAVELVSFHVVDNSLDIDISTATNPFSIHPDNGLIIAMHTLDRESVDHYLLRVTASDHLHTAETYLSITILDVNDHTPVLSVPDGIEIWEGQLVDSLVTDRVRASDQDVGVNSWVLFSLGEGWPEENFLSINPLSGVIRTNDTIVARENNLWFDGVVIAEDQGPWKRRTEQIMHLTVVKVNDDAPMFESGDSIDLSVSIADEVGTLIHHFEVTDVAISSSPFMFSIPPYYVMANRNFVITPATGLLTLREEQTDVRSYNFKIDVISNPSPIPRCVDVLPSSSINVTVNVRLVNTHCPEFTQATYSADVEEEVLITGSFTGVSSYDSDGDMVTYSLLNASSLPFTILDPRLGQIGLTASLDREMIESYSLTVLATDNGYPPMSCSAKVIVNVLDVNDHEPAFDQHSYTGSVMENLMTNSRVLQVHATDADIGDAAMVHYEIRQSNVPFTVDREFGYISTTQMLDYDTLPLGQYMFAVVASDSGGPRPLSTSVEVTITVEDVNEHPPRFITTPKQPIEVGANRVGGNLVFTVRANDSDRGAELFYSFGNPEPSCYFHVDNRTGAIELRVSPSSCSTCVDMLQRRSAPDPQYFIVDTNLKVSDGKYMDTVSVSFLIHTSLCASNPTTSILSVVIIATSIAVVLVIILVCIFALVCRAMWGSKVRINGTHRTVELQRTFANSPALASSAI